MYRLPGSNLPSDVVVSRRTSLESCWRFPMNIVLHRCTSGLTDLKYYIFVFKLGRIKNRVEERERNKGFGCERGEGFWLFSERVNVIEDFRRENSDEQRVKFSGFIGVVRIFPPKKWRWSVAPFSFPRLFFTFYFYLDELEWYDVVLVIFFITVMTFPTACYINFLLWHF